MEYEEIIPQMWKPENEGDMIEGELLQKQTGLGNDKTSTLYHLQTKDGLKKLWGSTILDDRMAAVKEGRHVRITYKGLGEAKKGKNAPKIFKVEANKTQEQQSSFSLL